MSEIEQQRVVVVTGASAGIGKAAAKELALRGWRVIGVGRNPERSQAALAELREAVPGAQIDMIIANLSELSQTKRAAAEIKALTDRVHVLLNNAGGITNERVVTSEGNEAAFVGNHVGPFLLTSELLPLLRATAKTEPAGNVRVINTSSSAAALSPGLDWDDVQMLNDHKASLAYCNVKLANLLFTRSLAERLAADGIEVKAVHPGSVDTNFVSYGDAEMQAIAAKMKDTAISAEQGADTIVWLATEPEIPADPYYFERAPYPVPAFALDDANCARLWTQTEAIIARSLLYIYAGDFFWSGS